MVAVKKIKCKMNFRFNVATKAQRRTKYLFVPSGLSGNVIKSRIYSTNNAQYRSFVVTRRNRWC